MPALKTPVKPALAMILATCKGDEMPGAPGRGIFWIAQNIGQGTNYELCLWNEPVRDDEEPLETAVRCANEQMWGHGHKFELEPSLFHPLGSWTIDGQCVHLFHMPWFLVPAFLKDNIGAVFLPVDFLNVMRGRITEPSREVLHSIPLNVLKLGAGDDNHVART